MPFDIPGSPSTRPLPTSHEVPKFEEEHKPVDKADEVHVSPGRGLRSRNLQIDAADAPRANAPSVTAQDVKTRFLDEQPGSPAELETMLGEFIGSTGAGRPPADWTSADFGPLRDVIKVFVEVPRPLANNAVRAAGKMFASHFIPLVAAYGAAHPTESVDFLIAGMRKYVVSGVLQEFKDGVASEDLAARLGAVIRFAQFDPVDGPTDLRMMSWSLQRPIRGKNSGNAQVFAAAIFKSCLIDACKLVLEKADKPSPLQAEIANMVTFCAKADAGFGQAVQRSPMGDRTSPV